MNARGLLGRVARRIPPPPGEPLVVPRQATRGWLTAALRDAGAIGDARVADVSIVSEQWSTTAAIARLALTYAGAAPPEAPRRLLLKIARRDLEPGFAAYAAQEVEYYRTIGRATGALSPACYGAAHVPAHGGGHLLLEDLTATHVAGDPVRPPRLEHCHETLDGLARLHATWWNHPQLGRGIGQVQSAEVLHGRLAEASALFGQFVDYWDGWLSPERLAAFERIVEVLQARRDHLTRREGLTVVHGDAHFGNVLCPRDAASGALRLIDWQFWHVGRGTADLVYLMAMHWFPERRRRYERAFVRRYHDALVAHGVAGYGWEQCWDDYRMGVVLTMLVPVWQWRWRLDPAIWSNHWERIWLAFEDLDCRELLDI